MSAESLIELQQKLTEDTRAYEQALTLKKLNENEREKGKRTIAELNALPPTTPAYRTVGRMFLSDGLPELVTTLNGMLVKVDEQVNALDKKAQYLQKQVKEDEKALNEVVRQIYEKRGMTAPK